MKKIIKLTESDLEQIVSKIITEQGNMFGTAGAGMKAPFTDWKSYSDSRKQPINKNVNPKGLKLGDGGNKNPEKIEDVKKLQQSLMNLGYLVTDTMIPTGYFGNLTNNALKALYSGAEPTNNKKQTTGKATPKTPEKTTGKVDTNKKITDFKDLKVSNQVKAQLNYMKSNNLLKSEKFTILDDKNSQVHAFNPNYELYHTYYVITGKNRGDQLKTQTMGDWVKENWKNVFSKFYSTMSIQDAATYADNCYFNQKEWEMKNTPSGVFKRAGVAENFLNDWVATTFMEKDYGKRFITWKTCEGKVIPFGFHGTKNESRLPVLTAKNIEKQSCSKRKMSFGCVNFNEKDVQEINSFINSGQITIWLPDESNNIVEIPSSCVSGSGPQKSIMSYDYMTQNYGKGFK
jgi:hypothetical protein